MSLDTKTLFLHIGHYKTGSSSIQQYLSSHRNELRELGFLYPLSCRPIRNKTNHGCLSLSLARDHGFVPPRWYRESISTDDAYAELLAEVAEANEPNIVISSEEFVQLALRRGSDKAVADLKSRLARLDVKILFFIREPMSLLKSWYNQVNKGPVATRNFPTFFNNLSPGFLAQHKIWRTYADAFGESNVVVRSYKHVGAAHIQDFFDAIGCRHRVVAQSDLVNKSQSIEKLELGRLKKNRNHSFGEITLTNVGEFGKFLEKVHNIGKLYQKVAVKADVFQPSCLNAENIMSYYADLLRHASEIVSLNPEEALVMRDKAVVLADDDPGLAAVMIEIAHIIQPNDVSIAEKLDIYRRAIVDNGMPHLEPKR